MHDVARNFEMPLGLVEDVDNIASGEPPKFFFIPVGEEFQA